MPIAPESHLSPDDYPQRIEHLMAPSHEQLAGIIAQVRQLANELPLAEVAELLGPTYGRYLNDRFETCVRAGQPALALPIAEALVAHRPDIAEYREMRAWCHAQHCPPDYTAALADYEWLASQPLPGYEHWLHVITEANPDCSAADNADQARHEHGRDLVLYAGAWLARAWALYNLGDLAAADAAFHHALSLPGLCIDHGYDHQRWQPGMLPPAVDADFLRWRLGQPNRVAWPEAIHEWADVVLRGRRWLDD